MGALSISSAQVCKGMGIKQIQIAGRAAAQAAVAAVPPDGTSPKHLPLCVIVLAHMHDEASLRLRCSPVADAEAPSRARSSKVMQHSAMLHFAGQEPLRWYEDLHPLADKRAPTLATSLRKVLVPVAETVGAVVDRQQAGQRPWMVHILIGDGVPTNEAAAKVGAHTTRADSFSFGQGRRGIASTLLSDHFQEICSRVFEHGGTMQSTGVALLGREGAAAERFEVSAHQHQMQQPPG